jgi:hypothetical protein
MESGNDTRTAAPTLLDPADGFAPLGATECGRAGHRAARDNETPASEQHERLRPHPETAVGTLREGVVGWGLLEPSLN